MSMPGYTAHVSLYPMRGQYRTTGAAARFEGRVLPGSVTIAQDAYGCGPPYSCCSTWVCDANCQACFTGESNYLNGIFADCNTLGYYCTIEPYDDCNDIIVRDGSPIALAPKWWSETDYSCLCNQYC
jgi:hypothetical protein